MDRCPSCGLDIDTSGRTPEANNVAPFWCNRCGGSCPRSGPLVLHPSTPSGAAALEIVVDLIPLASASELPGLALALAGLLSAESPASAFVIDDVRHGRPAEVSTRLDTSALAR